MANGIDLSGVSRGPCQRLRCKEMFVDMGEPFQMKDSGSGIYWCAHTQTCLGPDGQVAHVDECKPGRRCYEVL